MPDSEEVAGKWKQHVGAARIAWGKLTGNALLSSKGHEQRLNGLIQERCAITRYEAGRQVRTFIDRCSW
jgi:uncharacterized protein YjbJ (UPF0337 family)